MKTVPNTLGCLEEKPSKPGADATLIWVKRGSLPKPQCGEGGSSDFLAGKLKNLSRGGGAIYIFIHIINISICNKYFY